MKYLILLSLILCSCEMPFTRDCPESNMKVAGLCIESIWPVNPDEVRLLVEVLEKETKKRYPQVTDLIQMFEDNGVRVEFTQQEMAIDCTYYERSVYICDGYASGVNYDGWDNYVEYEECLAFSSMGHELLHSIEEFQLGGINDDHMTPWMFHQWAGGDKYLIQQIIEIRVKRILACQLASCAKFIEEGECDEED